MGSLYNDEVVVGGELRWVWCGWGGDRFGDKASWWGHVQQFCLIGVRVDHFLGSFVVTGWLMLCYIQVLVSPLG